MDTNAYDCSTVLSIQEVSEYNCARGHSVNYEAKSGVLFCPSFEKAVLA